MQASCEGSIPSVSTREAGTLTKQEMQAYIDQPRIAKAIERNGARLEWCGECEHIRLHIPNVETVPCVCREGPMV